jgi:hypothetical protein
MGAIQKGRGKRERKVYQKNGCWGLEGYIPTIVGMMGCFFGGREKEGTGLGN